MTKQTLVVYYSWSGTTKRAAKAIAEVADADLVSLTVAPRTFPATDMGAVFDVAKQQIKMQQLPPLTNALPDLRLYSTVLVGGPVWGSMVATPVRTFLTKLRGVSGTVAPFYTDAGTAGDYEDDFQQLLKTPTAQPGLDATNATTQLMQNWWQALGNND